MHYYDQIKVITFIDNLVNYIMKYFKFICCLIIFLGCDFLPQKKEQLTDLEKNQLKAVYLDLNAKKIDFKEFKGKRILINYWATWCKPCVEKMPDLLEVQKVLEAYNYVFLLASDEEITKIISFKNRRNYNFTFIKSQAPNETLGIYSLPTTFVFNEDGKMIEKIVGSVGREFDQMIEKLKVL